MVIKISSIQPFGYILLMKNHKPSDILLFNYMGKWFWEDIDENKVIERIDNKIGIYFYNIEKEYFLKLLKERTEEILKEDFKLTEECDEVWLIKIC